MPIMSNILRSNFARLDNTENIPPNLVKPTPPLRQHFGLHDNGAKRRRARVSGNFNKKAEQAIRKQHAQSRSPTKPRSPRRQAPAHPTSTSASKSPVPPPPQVAPSESVHLPRSATRGPVPKEKIAAVAPHLQDVPVEWLRHKLAERGYQGAHTTARATAPPTPRDAVPRFIEYTVPNTGYGPPSHCIALHGIRPPPIDGVSQKTPVRLVPVHGLNLAVFCENLDSLPPSRDPGQPCNDNASIKRTVPVVPLRVPYPDAFIPLVNYMYVRALTPLVSGMFPAPYDADMISAILAKGDKGVIGQIEYAKYLSKTYTPEVLKKHGAWTQGAWRNAMYMGLVDPPLLNGLDAAYATLAYALWAAEGNVEKLTANLGAERAKYLVS